MQPSLPALSSCSWWRDEDGDDRLQPELPPHADRQTVGRAPVVAALQQAVGGIDHDALRPRPGANVELLEGVIIAMTPQVSFPVAELLG